MKIKGKLILLELIIIFILFLAGLWSIGLFSQLYGTLEQKTIYREINSTLVEAELRTSKLRFENSLTEGQIVNFSNALEKISQLFDNATYHDDFSNLNTAATQELNTIRTNWQLAMSNLYLDKIEKDYYIVMDKLVLEGKESTSLHNINIDDYDDEEFKAAYLNLQQSLEQFQETFQDFPFLFAVAFEAIEEEMENQSSGVQTNLIVLNSIFIAITFLIVTLYQRKVSGYLKSVQKDIQDVSAGDFSRKAAITSKDEIGTLSRNLNNFTEVLYNKLQSVQQILHDVGQSIRNEIDLSKVEKAIVYLAKKNSGADGVALYRINNDNRTLKFNYSVGTYRPPYKLPDEEKIPNKVSASELQKYYIDYEVPFTEPFVGESVSTGESKIIKRVIQGMHSFAKGEKNPLFICSTLAVPLLLQDRVISLLVLVKNNIGDQFTDLEYTNMESFGELAAISIDSLLKYNEMLESFELRREIDIAAEIQEDLKPNQLPDLSGYQLAYNSRTLRGINGDYIDFYKLNDDKVLLTISEVAGKGVPAALVIIILKMILKLASSSNLTASEILYQTNKNITEKIKIDHVATMALLIIDVKSGAVSYASAGHQPLQFYNEAEETFHEFKPEGIPIGLDSNSTYEEQPLMMDEGDLILLYTDGVPESRDRNDNNYSVEALRNIVMQNPKLESEEIVELIFDDLNAHQKGAKVWDDQSVVIIKKEESEA